MRQPDLKLTAVREFLAPLLICALLLTATNLLAEEPTITTPVLAASEASSDKQLPLVWIDVRSWVEYKVDHISGDLRIADSEIVAGVEKLYPDHRTPIRLYCASGGRAGKASEQLRAAGYINVENAGGIDSVRAIRFGTDPAE